MLEGACHHLEDGLAVARDRGRLDSSLFRLLFATADAGRRLRDGKDLEDGPLARLTPWLEEAALAALTAPGPPPPASAPIAEVLTVPLPEPPAPADERTVATVRPHRLRGFLRQTKLPGVSLAARPGA